MKKILLAALTLGALLQATLGFSNVDVARVLICVKNKNTNDTDVTVYGRKFTLANNDVKPIYIAPYYGPGSLYASVIPSAGGTSSTYKFPAMTFASVFNTDNLNQTVPQVNQYVCSIIAAHGTLNCTHSTITSSGSDSPQSICSAIQARNYP